MVTSRIIYWAISVESEKNVSHHYAMCVEGGIYIPKHITKQTKEALVKEQMDKQVNEAAEILGITEYLSRRPKALSGGQRQAISLLMTTMSKIDFLILDEHTAALDPKTADVIMELTDKLVKEKNLTSIMVTHNLRYAIEYGSRLIMMHQGEAIIDKKGDDKKNMNVKDILQKFTEISIELGN